MIAELLQFLDHSGSARTLGLGTDRRTAFLVVDSLMQNLPKHSAKRPAVGVIAHPLSDVRGSESAPYGAARVSKRLWRNNNVAMFRRSASATRGRKAHQRHEPIGRLQCLRVTFLDQERNRVNSVVIIAHRGSC